MYPWWEDKQQRVYAVLLAIGFVLLLVALLI
jgi:hypothetical protein